MNCTSCGTKALRGSRFCNNCGSRLAALLRCRNCGSDQPAEANFCNICGQEMAGGRESAEARRQSLLAAAEIHLQKGDIEAAAEVLTALAGQLGGEEKAGITQANVEPAEPLVDWATGMEFLPVPGCVFEMGDLWEEGSIDERPVHPVTMPTFYLAKFPVTQDVWRLVMDSNPAEESGPRFVGPDKPVVNVSWADAQLFIQRLNDKNQGEYRLPSEAEWECAARSGGRRQKWAGTSDESELEDYAWYGKNSGRQLQPVGRKKPNDLGLYDLSGNVWEWCQDIWHNNYEGAPQDGSAWNEDGAPGRRVLRGGSWNFNAFNARTTYRDWNNIDYRFFVIGFRLVRIVGDV